MAFFESQFKCCSLAMFQSRQLNQRIYRLQERGLRHIYIYDDYNESFEKLLEQDRSFTTHEINIPKLAIEISSQP